MRISPLLQCALYAHARAWQGDHFSRYPRKGRGEIQRKVNSLNFHPPRASKPSRIEAHTICVVIPVCRLRSRLPPSLRLEQAPAALAMASTVGSLPPWGLPPRRFFLDGVLSCYRRGGCFDGPLQCRQAHRDLQATVGNIVGLDAAA